MSRRSFGTIRKLGSGRYQVRYRNSVGRMVAGPGTFATRAEAQRWLATAEADHLRGTFVDQRGLRLTFDEWVEEWLAAKPGQRAATLARDRAAIDTHFSPAIGHLTLPAVTPTHVRSIVTAMQARGLSPKSVRTYVGTLQAIFGAAVDSDLLARSPVRPRALGLETVRRPERPTLTADELVHLAEAVAPAVPSARAPRRLSRVALGRGDRSASRRRRLPPPTPQRPPDRRGGGWASPGRREHQERGREAHVRSPGVPRRRAGRSRRVVSPGRRGRRSRVPRAEGRHPPSQLRGSRVQAGRSRRPACRRT